MAIYEYRCPRCGVFDVVRSMGTATATARCATCGAAARRSYSAPLVNRISGPLGTALSRAEKSREQPEVVREVPPRRPVRRRTPAAPPPKGLPRW